MAVEDKAAAQSLRSDQPSTELSRRDKWCVVAAVATLMFIFDGLQASIESFLYIHNVAYLVVVQAQLIPATTPWKNH